MSATERFNVYRKRSRETSFFHGISGDIASLRRFARALTGNQCSGDSYVVATLDVIIADRSVLTFGADQRVNLYRIFFELWSTVLLNYTGWIRRRGHADRRHFNSIAPRPRMAFLLREFAGFNVEDIAEIMRSSSTEVSMLLEGAGSEFIRRNRLERATNIAIAGNVDHR
jgi:hypothetical protein